MRSLPRPLARWAKQQNAFTHVAGPTAALLIHGDSRNILTTLPEASVDLVLTDPPYFIDTLDEEWDQEKITRRRAAAKTVGSLPVGMKFDPEQGRRLQAFITPVFAQCLRVLKPGGFLVSFSQARLYHRMGVAAEDAGFEVRDMLGWTYEGQAKAFSQDHFLRKMKIPQAQKDAILASLQGRKTPQLKPMIEPMVFAQKPRSGTFIENWMEHGVGLVDTSQSWEGKFPGNLMNCPKPGKAEKGADTEHVTVKPLRVMEHLVRLLTVSGAVVLDPFAGSSTTQIAAAKAGRWGLGIEKDASHIRQSIDRFALHLSGRPKNR